MHLFVFLGIGSIALFSFLAVATWSGERRREREAYYRNETIRKIAESQGAGNANAMELLREEDRIATRRRREGQQLGGLITMAVGIGIMVFLGAITAKEGPHPEPVYLVGLIPLLIGLALLVYVYVLAPKE